MPSHDILNDIILFHARSEYLKNHQVAIAVVVLVIVILEFVIYFGFRASDFEFTGQDQPLNL